jgi:VWFA-related protein
MTALLLALALAFPHEKPDPMQKAGVQERVSVDRVVVDVYVTDKGGNSIPALTTADFRLRVDGRNVPIESTEWIASDQPEVDSAAAPSLAGTSSESSTIRPEPGAEQISPPGRLFILFFQTDLAEATRATGLLRIAFWARRFVETLLPTDRVAVVSFDSHLKLRQDFTTDHEKLVAAIHDAIRTGSPGPPDGEAVPSLFLNFDFEAARLAVTPEKAIAIVARAAAPIVGAKSMIYFGYGLRTIGGLAGPNPRDSRDLAEALPAVGQARISIFTVDTPTVGHTLSRTLEGLAKVTGGFYQKPDFLPDFVLDRVLRATAGRYVIVFRKPDLPRGSHTIALSLAGRAGRVLSKSRYLD